ncbi:MAG: Mur ligase family protein [Candidatus Saccharimonadales bacterium]
MKLRDMQAVDDALRPYVQVASRNDDGSKTLDRSQKLMAHIGHPERALRVVHVAGTSGKTSTTYYIAALLSASGLKVGHTVSPHVDSLTERVQINGVPLSEKLFCVYMGEFLERIADAPDTPSWFECMMAFVFWVFAKEQVNYAVIETGLGGLHDSSNVTNRADKLCVITDIGYDHMHMLGDTLLKIAYQKAGIIHDGNTALMYDQDPEIMTVVRYWVSQQEDAELLTFEQDRLANAYHGDFPAGMPEYQKRNWLLAFAAYKFLVKRDELRDNSATKLQKTMELQVPGRMDERRITGKTILMDGAHNGQKMSAFWQSFAAKYPGVKPVVLLALKQGKEIADIVPLLQNHAAEVIVTTFTKTQDLPLLSIGPSEITSVLQANGVKCEAIVDQGKAYEAFIKRVEDLGVITGSFFLISQLREGHRELR